MGCGLKREDCSYVNFGHRRGYYVLAKCKLYVNKNIFFLILSEAQVLILLEKSDSQ